MNHYLISFFVFIPLLGALFQSFLPKPKSRWVSLGASLLASVGAFALIFGMKNQTADIQAVEYFSWISSYAISYEMGIDGLNALPVVLIGMIFPILIASEWNQKIGVKGVHGLFLLLQSALFGAVCAQDLFLQFFFWGLSALPIYFLVGIWGAENRERASFRTFIASSLGDAFIFTALVLIYYSVDPHSFSLRELSGGRLAGKVFEFWGHEFSISGVAFTLMSIGLSLRVPIWPFHGWFTEVAEEAPPSVFVALCAGIIPVGTYIFARLSYVLFPEALGNTFKYVVVIGILNLILGGVCAVAQKGLRKLLAYLCISEVGLVLIGLGSLSSVGVVGAVYEQLIFGLALAGFGLFSGLITQRTGRIDFIGENQKRVLGGIAIEAPMISIVAGIVLASLLGFPGLGGFVGHSLIMIGSFTVRPFTVIVAASSLLLASYYLFKMYRYVFLGEPTGETKGFEDLTVRERAYLFPLVVGLLFFGLYPKPLIELIRPTVLTLLSSVK